MTFVVLHLENKNCLQQIKQGNMNRKYPKFEPREN